MKIVFHPLFVCVFAVSWVLGFGIFMLALLSAVIVHELSHTLAANYFGIRTRELRLLPFGAEISIDCGFLTVEKKIIILLAGAFGNIIVAIMCGSLLWLFPGFFMFLELVIAANAVPALLNLLPVYPLDGGKVLALVMSDRAIKWFVWVSNVLLGLLFVCGCIFFFNLPLLILCVVMIISINFDLKGVRFTSKIKAAGKNVGGHITEVAVTSDMTLFQVFKLVSAKYYTKFVLADRGNQSFYESDLEKILVNNVIDKKIGQVI